MQLLARIFLVFFLVSPILAAEPSAEARQIYTEAVMWCARNDWPKGIQLLTRAGELDHPQAAYLLSGYYTAGNFVKKDPALAMKWGRRAYELKYPGSPDRLIELLTTDRSNQAALDEAKEILAKAESETPKWPSLPQMRARVAGTPIPPLMPPVAAAPVGAKPVDNKCKTCNGRGRVTKFMTWKEYDGRWGNKPWVTETKKEGLQEVTCQTCRGRGTTSLW